MDWDRKSQIIERIAGALCFLTVAGSAAFFAWDAHLTQAAARGAIAPSSGTLTSLQETLEFIKRPCASVDAKGKLLQDGPICELDQAIHDIRKIVTLAGNQVKQTDTVVRAAANSLDQVGGAVAGTADQATETLDSARGTFDQATETLKQVNSKQTGITPLMASYAAIATNVNGYLERKAISDFVNNLGPLSANAVAISGTGAHMLLTADQVETKATYTYLHPSPNPWIRTWNAAEPWMQIGAQGLVKLAPVIH